MTRKSFSGAAVPTTLAAPLSSSATTFTVAAISGWPNTTTGPFVVCIDRGVIGSEEKILCSSYIPGTGVVTVAGGGRGYDGTTAVGHSVPATVNCTLDAVTIDGHDAFVAGNGTVTPTVSAVADVAFPGTSTLPAAADHRHGREQFASGSTTNSAPGDTVSDGSSASPARADHKHARESFGSSVSSSNPGDAGTVGTAATVARSDHQHAREAATTDSGWTTPTLVNSWTASTPVSYRKIGSVVYLRGSLTGGVSNQTAFTLPSGYYNASFTFKVPTSSSLAANAANAAWFQVDTGGNVIPEYSGGVTSEIFALDSISLLVS